MGSTKIVVDDNSVMRAINASPGIKPLLKKHGQAIASRADSLGAGYRTAKYYDREAGELKGGKRPEYGATLGTRYVLCLVHPENYAAMKDNYLHNTLLKAI